MHINKICIQILYVFYLYIYIYKQDVYKFLIKSRVSITYPNFELYT